MSSFSSVLENAGLAGAGPIAGTFDGTNWLGSGSERATWTPISGEALVSTRDSTPEEVEQALAASHEAFLKWRMVPSPQRGEFVRLWGEQLRTNKHALGELISLEMGKSLQEGLGEVQEMIDICDFAVGLSRQLYGNTMHSERPLHRMYEQWHPLGVVACISAFNFPMAVYAWNAALALVCGDAIIWKPSEKTPLCAIAVMQGLAKLALEHGHPGIATLVQGGPEVGNLLTKDQRIPLVSATGSTRMGKKVGEVVGARLGRTILELGGNNAIIVSDKADLGLAMQAVVFGAVGTAGQRCTSTRRVYVHDSIYDKFKATLTAAYSQIKVGNPLEPSNHMGPLIDQDAVGMFADAVASAKSHGAELLVGGDVLDQDGCYVAPTIFECNDPEFPLAKEETFAPILYLFKFSEVDGALTLQNNVRQGLSSAIFTTDMHEMERFLAASGSDCGIANVNIGTSGAEIGGAFGGEKDTGGGRESGSDSWKQYMRRQTNTINWGRELPLAQGIEFKF